MAAMRPTTAREDPPTRRIRRIRRRFAGGEVGLIIMWTLAESPAARRTGKAPDGG